MEIQGKWFSTVSTRLLLLSLLLALLPTMASAQTNLGIKQRPKISESSQDIIQFAVPTNDGLVAYYPFNGNANDESGNGNNGIPMESVTLTTGVHGDANGAYQFGGTDNPGNIHVPNSESLQIGDSWSFAAYVKPMSIAGMTGWGIPGDQGRFCIMGKSHDQHGVAIDYELPTAKSFSVDLSSWGWDALKAIANGSHLGKWTHVAITKSGNHYKAFINGEMLSEAETEHDFSRANGEDMYFGKYNDSWYPMNGMLDEVRIYNRTLTAEEVKELAKYADNTPTLEEGLVAYYPFNGNANDESGNGNNGTPMESVTLTTGVHGDANGAYQFGGTDNPGNIHVPNSESLQIGDGWSFAAYVKPMSIAGMTGWGRPGDLGHFCIMGKSHDQHGVSIKYGYPTDDTFNVNLTSWGWDEIYATANGSHLGKWTHVAITKSGNHYKAFINGEMLSEAETEHDFSRANSEDMYFGKYNDSWYPMNGMLDEVRIYNRTLTAEEVKELAKYADKAAPKGDVNGDGVVDVADISSIISVMSKGDNNLTADVNGDGVVDVADISTVITIMAGKNYDAVLQIWLSDGQVTVVNLSEEPRTTYSDGNLTITTTKTTITYPLERVRRYTYANVNNGYNSRQGTFVTNDGETLILTGMEANAAITLYNSAGQLLHTDSTNSQGAAIVSVSHFPQGKYTIKSNGVTYKITKQ